MQIKKITKIMSVVLALTLMLSSLPLNFLQFLNNGKSFAEEATSYTGAIIDTETGEITNKDKATYVFDATPENEEDTDADILIWLSESTVDAVGRKYKLEFYSENAIDLKLYFKDFINVFGETTQDTNSAIMTPDDTIETVKTLDINIVSKELLTKNIIISDNIISIVGSPFFAVSSEEAAKVYSFPSNPSNDLKCAPYSDIKILNAQNDIITYTNAQELKFEIESEMNGPFEMYFYDTKFDNLDIDGKTFETIISSIDESIENSEIKKSCKFSLDKNSTIGSEFLKNDASTDYTIILKDKFGMVAVKTVKVVRDVKLVNVHLVTSPKGDFDNADAMPILTDKYGVSVNSMNVEFVATNSEFTFDIPTIKGYTLIKSDIGTIDNSELKHTISTDTDIYVYYEAFAPNFDLTINSTNKNIYPQNPLSQYPNATSNIFSFEIDNLANSGNANFDNGSIVIKLPIKDANGTKFNFKNMILSTGTFINVGENATMTVYYSENDTVYNLADTINIKTLSEIGEVNLPDNTRFIKLEFNEDALVSGASIGTKPTLSFTLEYDGDIIEQDFIVTANALINYKDDEDKSQRIEKETETSSKILNPIHTITVNYVSKDDDNKEENIKSSITASIKYHNLIDIEIDKISIKGYDFAYTTTSADLVTKDDKNYMPNSDVVITHYYYEKKPYIADTQINTTYKNVYINDSNIITFTDIGAYKISETQGNIAMYEYRMVLTVPAEFQLRRINIPDFDGNKTQGKIEYRLSSNAPWKEYTKDIEGKDTTINSKNEYCFEIANMYEDGKASELQIRITYGNSIVPLPEDFHAQGKMMLVGTVVDDSVSTAKIELKSSVKYPDRVSGEDKTLTETKEDIFNIYQPAIADVEQDGNLTVPNSDKYTYVFNNIKNDGSSPLNNFKFTYEFDADTYLDNINIGTFNNTPTNGNIVVETIFADDTKKENIISYEELKDLTNPDASKIEFINNIAVKKIIISFGNVPTGFENVGGIKITTFTRLTNGESSKKVIANAELTAVWKSENTQEDDDENSGTLSKKITTETTVAFFDKIEAGITISNPIVLPMQTTDVSINNLNNKYDIDLFNVQSTLFADDESVISKLSTGAYSYTSKYNFENLIIYAYTPNGIVKVYDEKIPTVSSDITLPEGTTKVTFSFSVLNSGFKATEKPVVTFVTNATADAHIKYDFKYNVGVYKTNIVINDMATAENTGVTQTSTITDEQGLLTVGTPSVVKPTFTTPEEVYFSDAVLYKANGIKNDGNISLYQSVIAFVPSEFETVKNVNIGKWSDDISGTIGYATAEMVEDEVVTELVELKKFNNVKELEDIEVPTSEKQVIMVYIIINELKPNVEMTEDAVFEIKLDNDNVQPQSVLTGKIAFNTNYGIVKDANALTQAEADKLTNIASTEKIANVLVIKPAIVFPNMTVSSETVEYRGQFTYTISNIKNTGNTSLEKFEIIEMFSQFVRFVSLKTPTFNELTTFDIYYRTNVGEEWVLLQADVNARESIEVFAPELPAGEYVSYIKFDFKDGVSEEFASTADMTIECVNWSSAYSIEDIVSTTEVNATHTTTTLSARNSVYYTPEIPSILQAGFEVVAPEKIYPGQKIELVYKNVKNVSEATINKHTLTQYLTADYKVIGINTGSYESGYSSDTLRVLYKTNLSKEGQMFELKADISISENMYLEFPDLVENEYITEVSIKFGDTKEGFAEITSPSIIIEALETIENSSEYSLDAELIGLIDEKGFGEIVKTNFATEYGFVTVVAKDAKGNTISTYKVYGNVGENFTINEVALKGYTTVSSDGDISGTYKLGESGNITFTCKEVPKTAYKIFTDWKFILGAVILIGVGITCFVPKKKKITE